MTTNTRNRRELFDDLTTTDIAYAPGDGVIQSCHRTHAGRAVELAEEAITSVINAVVPTQDVFDWGYNPYADEELGNRRGEIAHAHACLLAAVAALDAVEEEELSHK